MKGHVPSHPNDYERKLLKRAKHAPSSDTHWNSPEKMASLVAVGKITRENSCDGKARFIGYDYAENTARPIIEARYNTHLEVYACVFCSGFHLATREEFAA